MYMGINIGVFIKHPPAIFAQLCDFLEDDTMVAPTKRIIH